ncbi:MAG: nucleoside deaminase [Rhodospirillaceae bacterium]
MDLALAEARAAAARAEVPVGAVVTGPDGAVLARAGNRTLGDQDPAAHAEILALRDAGKALGSARLVECTLWVTLEPCPMCAGAIEHARIGRLVFGAYDPKGGGVDHGPRVLDHPNCRHRPEIVGGVQETACADLLRAFFQERR